MLLFVLLMKLILISGWLKMVGQLHIVIILKIILSKKNMRMITNWEYGTVNLLNPMLIVDRIKINKITICKKYNTGKLMQ